MKVEGLRLGYPGSGGACWSVSGASFVDDNASLAGDRALSGDKAVVVGTDDSVCIVDEQLVMLLSSL